jgi:hypothetical protein
VGEKGVEIEGTRTIELFRKIARRKYRKKKLFREIARRKYCEIELFKEIARRKDTRKKALEKDHKKERV